MSTDPLVRRFAFHPITDDEAGRSRVLAHERVRAAGLAFAQLVHDIVPEGRELDRAIDAIDDAVMQANAGLARPADPELMAQSMAVGKIATGVLSSEIRFGSITSDRMVMDGEGIRFEPDYGRSDDVQCGCEGCAAEPDATPEPDTTPPPEEARRVVGVRVRSSLAGLFGPIWNSHPDGRTWITEPNGGLVVEDENRVGIALYPAGQWASVEDVFE